MDDTGIFSKESQRIIDRFPTEIGGCDLYRRFQGVVNPETVTSFDMTNDPVFFVENFRSRFAVLPSWALPDYQAGSTDQSSMPLRDEQTPIQVPALLPLLSDHFLTKKTHKQNAMVTVPTVDNRQLCRPATDLTAPDLLRVFVFEFIEPGQPEINALAVRNQLHLLPDESWMPATHRTLKHTRGDHVQYYKPHAMEAT